MNRRVTFIIALLMVATLVIPLSAGALTFFDPYC